MTAQFALGHFLRLVDDTDTVVVRLQNFFISEAVSHQGGTYIFAPFGFSGVSTTRQGDLEPATLVFPNNAISRGYITDSLKGQSGEQTSQRFPYIGEVDVCLVDVEQRQVSQVLFTYTGQATASTWDDSTAKMELSSVIDAATNDVPIRTLVKRVVGSLPTTTKIQLR